MLLILTFKGMYFFSLSFPYLFIHRSLSLLTLGKCYVVDTQTRICRMKRTQQLHYELESNETTNIYNITIVQEWTWTILFVRLFYLYTFIPSHTHCFIHISLSLHSINQKEKSLFSFFTYLDVCVRLVRLVFFNINRLQLNEIEKSRSYSLWCVCVDQHHSNISINILTKLAHHHHHHLCNHHKHHREKQTTIDLRPSNDTRVKHKQQ